MKKVAMFDAKPYDHPFFERFAQGKYELLFLESKLNENTARLAEGCAAVCAFVNDDVNAAAIERLSGMGVEVLAMRSAGYSNVDVKAAYGKIHIVRVPAYSPYAVAEHAMGLLLCVNRKLHKAYNRTRDFNFSLAGLTGMDLHGKTVGVIGTGKIGQVFMKICCGFGMRVIAYDPYPLQNSDVEYVALDELLRKSDVISLHCPLTEKSHHLIDREAFAKMKQGVLLINTSRGALIDTAALLDALAEEKVRGAGLDVYEEEEDFFFEDFSDTVVKDDVLSLLISRPNVVLTAHQAFLTEEALSNIAETTISNLDDFWLGKFLPNEVCYLCDMEKAADGCPKKRTERCF